MSRVKLFSSPRSGQQQALIVSDYSRVMGAEGSNFKRFVDEISLGSSLPSELKSKEMVMPDSSILITCSNLESKGCDHGPFV